MPNYTLKGFSAPPGIDSKEKVKALQLRLNVKADGIWGPKTEAAWQTQAMDSRNLKNAIPNATISKAGITPSSSEKLKGIIDLSNIGETQKQRAKLSIDHLDNQKQDVLLLDVMLDGVESYFSKEAWQQGAYELMTGDNSTKLFNNLVKPGEGIARQVLNMDAYGDSRPRMDYNGINRRFVPTSSRSSLEADSAKNIPKVLLVQSELECMESKNSSNLWNKPLIQKNIGRISQKKNLSILEKNVGCS